jgi:predicted GIY-YIG superfamily endonuclease
MSYVVYVIGLQENLTPPYHNCYVGVTNDMDRRWKYHYNSKYSVGTYIRSHNLSRDNMISIFSGTEEECFDKEYELRPYQYIGLNEAAGGHGGSTTYTKERNEKISAALTGRKITWADKIVASRGSYKGSKNPSAKGWELLDPEGRKHEIYGNLQEFCDQNDLLLSSLTYYKGKRVPPIQSGGYGGYRAKNEESKRKRENTAGWLLYWAMEN